MENVVLLPVPFNQDHETIKEFEFWNWRFYLNRARLNGCTWICRKTKPKGIYALAKDGRGGFVHKLTARVRHDMSGVSYLQLICFSWWVAVVRKSDGVFDLKKEMIADEER